MTVTFYTTGCPRCKMLRQILDDKKVDYAVCTDVNSMEELGLSSVPALSVNGILMLYNEAVKWAMEQGGKDEEQ